MGTKNRLHGESCATGVFLQREGLLVEGFASGFPAGDACGEVLHVGVAEFASSVGSSFVSTAGWAAAIGNDESVLVSRELRSEVSACGGEVNGSRDMTVLVGCGTIDVDDGDFLVSDGLLEVGDSDVREIGGHHVDAGDQGKCEGEEFLHSVDVYW